MYEISVQQERNLIFKILLDCPNWRGFERYSITTIKCKNYKSNQAFRDVLHPHPKINTICIFANFHLIVLKKSLQRGFVIDNISTINMNENVRNQQSTLGSATI